MCNFKDILHVCVAANFALFNLKLIHFHSYPVTVEAGLPTH